MLLKTWIQASAAAALGLLPLVASAEPNERARGIDSVFFISRSENRNQVHYALKVGEDCRPHGSTPVHAYWRMLELGAQETEELLDIEGPVYGVDEQQQVGEAEQGWRILVRLRAHPDRPIEFTVRRENGRCTARAWMKVNGERCQLQHIFVRTQWPFGVDYVRLNGTAADGRVVTEVVRP